MVVGGRNENQELLGTTEEFEVSSGWFWKSLSNITDGKIFHCQVDLSLILDIVLDSFEFFFEYSIE